MLFHSTCKKTLPTPLLSNSKVYYLRQLWTYNLGVHNLVTGSGTMFMRSEHEASRGSQEIMSCLLKFIKNLPTNITHIDAFSDNAGGQNKNNNIIKFRCYVVSNTQIQSVDHRFLVSGHSFLECDQDFAVIEKTKRKCNRVFVPDDRSNVVAKSSRKFNVERMTQEDFKSIHPMTDLIRGNIKGVRKMQRLHFQKSSPPTLYYKETVNERMSFFKVDLKKSSGRPPIIELPPLYTAPLKIKLAKYKNLIELLPFIPPVHHSFFKALPHHVKGKASKKQIKQPAREVENHEEDETENESDVLESDYDD